VLDSLHYRRVRAQEKKKEQQVSRALSCEANLKLEFQQNHKVNFINSFAACETVVELYVFLFYFV